MVSTRSQLPKNALTPAAAEEWLARLPASKDEKNRAALKQVVLLSLDKLGKRQDRTGQQLPLYCLHIADLMIELGLDDLSMLALILYRLVDEGCVGLESLQSEYGEAVARLVKDLLQIHRLSPGVLTDRDSKGEEHSENLRRMLLAIASDVRALLIVLTERVHLMRRLEHLSPAMQQQFSRNTRDIFAPLANRLGIWHIKWELEDLALRFLDPDAYRAIARQLEERREQRLHYIDGIIRQLESAFADAGIAVQISGRPKHIYSIWKKMQRKHYDFSHIFDVRAVRVLVNSITDCYAALGVVHALWKHVPHEFDDYIATPKANMYQSIHTVVIGPEDKPLEVQIRTHEMDLYAEQGIAAHWRYKEGGEQHTELEKRIEWMRQWLENREEQSALTERSMFDAEQQLIYVLTPQGKVIELPVGATPVDFAYAIHSSVGHRCRGARVDGQIVSLSTPLRSAQTVEILTQKEERPSRDWLSTYLGYTQTARARSCVRAWYRQQDFASHIEMGKAALEREFSRLGFARQDLPKIAPAFHFKTADDLLAAIGRGDVSPVQVAGWHQREEREGAAARRPLAAPRKKRGGSAQQKNKALNIRVDGIDDLMTQLGKCCKPVPYDPIIGYITRGRGVTVHRQDCAVVLHMDDDDCERLVSVQWIEGEEGQGFAVDIRILAHDRKGLLRDITALFSNEEINVTGVKTHSDSKQSRAVMRFSVEIDTVTQLSRILDKVSQLPDVLDVARIT
jgi:GTP pyrophosphokinase